MDKTLNVAVIGAGYWGTKLVREYLAASKEREDINLKAIYDVDFNRLKTLAKELSLPEGILTTSYEDILGRDDINAVHIATPNETHYDLAMQAINANKHIVLEKPMTLSSRKAFRLAREAEKKNIILLVDHIFRFNNALNATKELLESGKFGNLYYMTLKWSAYLEPPTNRDIIFDLAPHPIDIVNYLTEEWPAKVYGNGKSYIRGKVGLEEMAFITAELPDDVLVNIELSWIDYGKKTRVVNIVTEKGTLVIDTLAQTLTIYSNSQKKEIPITPNNTIRDMICHFADRVLNNEPPLNSATVGAMTVFILEKIRESVEKGETVEIFRGD
ncbi:MAG: Gfo/Idh/MocA family protein [Candidatus Njordarchaeia archaeon]